MKSVWIEVICGKRFAELTTLCKLTVMLYQWGWEAVVYTTVSYTLQYTAMAAIIVLLL